MTRVEELEQMTAVQLRQFARDEGIRITYITDRRREKLIDLIAEELQRRGDRGGPQGGLKAHHVGCICDACYYADQRTPE